MCLLYQVIKNNGVIDYDLVDKIIIFMGGFFYYGEVNQDFVMIKGCCMGFKKRVIIFRKVWYIIICKVNLLMCQISMIVIIVFIFQFLLVMFRKKVMEKISFKFIDIFSKYGYGRFQIFEEKKNFLGFFKKDVQKEVV